jgi:deoxycytidine triphosphate deaminase
MVLNDTEIQQRINSAQLLSSHDPGKIRNCGYTLRAGKVFQPKTGEEILLNVTANNTRAVVWEIGASETLIVRTKEKVKMSNDLCATYAPLYHLSSLGVMLLNASIVEPGYEGPLSCFLVNFSSERISLEPDAEVAKIMFHRLSAPPGSLKPMTIEDQKYEAGLAVYAKKFHKSFMDITGVEDRAVEKAREAVKKWVVFGGALVAFLLLWATLEPLLSKWLWEKTGIYTTTQRVEDTKLLKDLEAAQLKAEIERLKIEIQNLKKNERRR